MKSFGVATLCPEPRVTVQQALIVAGMVRALPLDDLIVGTTGETRDILRALRTAQTCIRMAEGGRDE